MPIVVKFPFGVWESADAGHRWKLTFLGPSCAWEERRGGAVKRTASGLTQSAGQWRTERVNDPDVLRFLGAQTVADEIWAQKPPPSYMLVQQQGDSVAVSWNGLSWSLTPAGHLRECHIAPPQQYVLRNTFEGVWNGRMWIGDTSFDISIMIYRRGGQLHGQLLVPARDDQGSCDGIQIVDGNISFSVGENENRMDFSGVASAGCSNLGGSFRSQFGNGQWEVAWVKVEEAGPFMVLAHRGALHAGAPRFAPSELFSGNSGRGNAEDGGSITCPTRGDATAAHSIGVSTFVVMPTKGGLAPTDASALGWDIMEDLYFEGVHFEIGSWHSQKWIYENKNPGGRVECDQQELKRDNDAKWEFFRSSESRVEYTLSAKSCILRCDEVRLRVFVRFVSP